jgi:predicted HicB family RNase H-like nuclease
MTNVSREHKLLQQAKELADTAETWADLSNALFDQEHGIVARAFATRQEREAFKKTPEYQQIWQLLDEVMERTGLETGATPKRKSGRFVVRLPQSLHAALEVEANREGVSLNQLVMAKLAVQLKDAVRS